MGDYRLPPRLTLIVGMTGSGKSTFAYSYLQKAEDAVCRFLFDDFGRAATRLNMTPCYTARQAEDALQTRWVITNPHRMFPGQVKIAFDWWCQWVYDASLRGPGRKLALVDEAWQFQTNQQIPYGLAKIAQAGREENIELVLCSQLPHRFNASLIGQATELVCFHLKERLALDCVSNLGADPDIVRNLPLGKFVSYNLLNGASVTGQVF
jgi:DNA helicase HerA-like ATPase